MLLDPPSYDDHSDRALGVIALFPATAANALGPIFAIMLLMPVLQGFPSHQALRQPVRLQRQRQAV